MYLQGGVMTKLKKIENDSLKEFLVRHFPKSEGIFGKYFVDDINSCSNEELLKKYKVEES